MAKIVWTVEAARWMKDIHDYIAQDNPRAAQRLMLGIYDKIQVLQVFPEMGQVYRKEGDGLIRLLLYGHYKIVYLAKPESVVILGVFHDAMDIERYLA